MSEFSRRRLLALAAGVATVSPGLGRAADPRAAAAAAAAAAMDGLAKSDPFYGVFLLGQGLRAEVVRAYGFADVEAGRRAEPGTRYGIASISKWFVSIAALRLCEQGKLALDAPITTWLKDYRADTGNRLTLRRLLSNRSGVPNGFIAALRADPSLAAKETSTAEAVRAYASGDLAFEPGAKFDYSLTNWILVRAILEAATGESLDALMSRLVFAPLGLRDTGWPIAGARPAVAVPYGALTPAPVQRMTSSPQFAVASGGFYSTAADLQRAAHAVFRKGFLSDESRRALTTIEVPEEHYTLGGRVKDLRLPGGVRRFAWETGNSGGHKCLLAHGLDDHRTLVILNNTNLTQKRIDEFAYAILGAAYGGEATPV